MYTVQVSVFSCSNGQVAPLQSIRLQTANFPIDGHILTCTRVCTVIQY